MASILISGVSSGYGNAIAREYLEQGDTVYGLSRRKPEDLLRHKNFHFESSDLTVFKNTPSVLKSLLTGVHELDGVILNAGVLWKIADMADAPLENLMNLMDINVWANKPILDYLFYSGIKVTQVIAISSGAAIAGARGWNGYSLSKAALNMLVKLYSREQPHTHFTAFAPGLIETAMQNQIFDLPEDKRFPSITFLQQARGTLKMPSPKEAASLHIQLFLNLRKFPSGEFLDIRTMPKV